jgi:hypothetical protein
MRCFALAILLALLCAAPPSSAQPKRSGPIRVSGRAVADGNGEFAALGATMFWAAWAYKHDRPRLDEHLKLLADHGFDYIRALGVVGRQPVWAGREIDWRWPDYDQVIAGVTDHAYDRFGIRVEWTIFGDADQVIPEPADRVALVDRFLAMSRGREHKIMHFEVANESFQNGFGGPAGIQQIRQLAERLASGTTIPIAVSDSEGHDCEAHLTLYRDLKVEILTEHFTRDVNGPLRNWEPVLAPWGTLTCKGLPPIVSSNEPIGPESSVNSEPDPVRLVGAALSSYLAGVAMYVLHTDAGVWGRRRLMDMPNAEQTLAAFSAMKKYLPPDIVNWRRHRHDSAEHPFIPHAGSARGAIWPDGHNDGAAELLAGVKEDQFFVVPVGVVNSLKLEARRAMTFEVLHPLTGARIEQHTLAAGQSVNLRPLPALIIKGRFH